MPIRRPTTLPFTHPRIQLKRRLLCSSVLLGGLPTAAVLLSARATAKPVPAVVQDEAWFDPARNRSLPIKVRWPQAPIAVPCPVIVFSHGLGGTTEGGAVWGAAWAAAGFVVVHMQHPGSDLDAVRQTATSFRDQRGLLASAGPEQFAARIHDTAFVMDEIARRHAQAGLAPVPTAADLQNGVTQPMGWGHVRLDKAGMSGHSFGAHTTLALAGQRFPNGQQKPDARFAAFAAFSPTLPRGDATRALAGVTRPLLSLTGTLDGDVVGTGATPDKRAAVFAALPSGKKAQLVLLDADHMTFGGQTGRAAAILKREAITADKQALHHSAIADITTQWWRAHLLTDPAPAAAAAQWLKAPANLSAGDVWAQG